jgi:hypothetical protein
MPENPIQVGTLVVAKRTSGVCVTGERGVCYEVYQLGGRQGYGIIFEGGRHDGFSPEDVAMFLDVTDQVCPAVTGYQFTNVSRLLDDFRNGRFADAFPPRHRGNGRRI